MRINFTVYAVPVAQPRARATTIGGKARMYEAETIHPIHAFKAAAAMAASQVHAGPPLDGALSLSALFVLPRPKSKRWKTRPIPRYWHTKKPDLDNLVKGLQDALNGLLWHNDTQVCRYANVEKCVASGDEKPHCEITVTELEGGYSR